MRGLPVNLEAEKLVLGAAMLDPAAAVSVLDGLTAADFALEKHKRIFGAMVGIRESGATVDRITVLTEVRRRGELESVDGAAYLTTLDDDLPQIYNPEAYIRLVRDKARLRSLIVTAQGVIDRCLLEGDPAEIAAVAQVQIAGVEIDQQASSLLSFAEVVARDGGMERYMSPPRGMQTPWGPLNFLMPRGLHAGDLVIVGARPSIGKTAFACQWSTFAAATGVGVGMFSLEMGDSETYRRALANIGDIDMGMLFTGRMQDHDRRKVASGAGRLAEMPFYISESMKVTTAEMVRSITRARAAGRKIGLVVIDYLQLMQASRGRGNANEEITEISRSLKIAARELQCPFVVLSQLSRKSETEDREPRLSDLRDSGAIEQDADVIVFLHRKASEVEESRKSGAIGRLKVILAKQRQGPIGSLQLQFNAPRMRLEEIQCN